MSYLDIEQPCHLDGDIAREQCDHCKRPTCEGHLFKTGVTLEFPSDPRSEWYAEEPTWSRQERFCLPCYIEARGLAPYTLWQDTGAETTLSVLAPIRRGVATSAGDDLIWYAPPGAPNALLLRWGQTTISYTLFQVLQLLDFLKVNEDALRKRAAEVSAVLVEIARRDTIRAREADAFHGPSIFDYEE